MPGRYYPPDDHGRKSIVWKTKISTSFRPSPGEYHTSKSQPETRVNDSHSTIYTPPYHGIPGICAASFTSLIQLILSPANSSPLGGFLLGHSGSSRMPALMMTAPGNDSPVRKSVVPQSGQKCEVIFLPVSAVLEISLGLPALCISEMRGGVYGKEDGDWEGLGREGRGAGKQTRLKLEVLLRHNEVVGIGPAADLAAV